MSYSDDKFGTLFPVRNGEATGSAHERKMLDAIGGADSFRTRIQNNADGSTTIMRTKGGMPQFETTRPVDPPKEQVKEYEWLCAVKCPAYSSDYTLSSSDVSYVSMDIDGGSPVVRTRTYYYDKLAFVSKWSGNGKEVVYNGVRDGTRWQGMNAICIDSMYLSTNGVYPRYWAVSMMPTGELPVQNSGITGSESKKWGAAVFKPPGSPIRWFSWSEAAGSPPVADNPQFVDGYGAEYAELSGIYGGISDHIEAAFYQTNDVNSDLCYIKCTPDTVSTYGQPMIEGLFGTLVNVTQGTSYQITYEDTPTRGYLKFHGVTAQQTYSNMPWFIPIAVNSSGTRAVGLFRGYYRRGTNNYATMAGVAMDINLLTHKAKVLEADGYYMSTQRGITIVPTLIDFGFVGDEMKILCRHREDNNGQYQDRGLYLGSASLLWLKSLSPRVWVECPYANIQQGLFVAAVMHMVQEPDYMGPELTWLYDVAFVVIYHGAVVKTFYVTQKLRQSGYPNTTYWYENQVVGTNSAANLFSVDTTKQLPMTGQLKQLHTHRDETFSNPTDGIYQTWEGPLEGLISSYTVCATVDSADEKIAVSIVLSNPLIEQEQAASYAPRRPGSSNQFNPSSWDVAHGPVTINHIIDIASGTSQPFGSDAHYYNRLHYQKVKP